MLIDEQPIKSLGKDDARACMHLARADGTANIGYTFQERSRGGID